MVPLEDRIGYLTRVSEMPSFQLSMISYLEKFILLLQVKTLTKVKKSFMVY
jgi:hypothetical protein